MVVGSLLDRIKEGGVGIANKLLISLDGDDSLQGCGFSLNVKYVVVEEVKVPYAGMRRGWIGVEEMVAPIYCPS